MKIFSKEERIADLPSEQKNYAGGVKKLAVFIEAGADDVILGRYSTHERALEVSHDLYKAYMRGDESFTMPED